MTERRATQRHRVLKGATIQFNKGQSTLSCTVRNLSDTGALLKLSSVVGVPDEFTLAMADGTRYACEVVRRTGTELGVRFKPA